MAYNAIFLRSALIHVVQVYGTLNKLATLEVTSVQPGIKKLIRENRKRIASTHATRNTDENVFPNVMYKSEEKLVFFHRELCRLMYRDC